MGGTALTQRPPVATASVTRWRCHAAAPRRAAQALKKVGQLLAVTLGLLFALIQGLAYAGIITVSCGHEVGRHGPHVANSTSNSARGCFCRCRCSGPTCTSRWRACWTSTATGGLRWGTSPVPVRARRSRLGAIRRNLPPRCDGAQRPAARKIRHQAGAGSTLANSRPRRTPQEGGREGLQAAHQLGAGPPRAGRPVHRRLPGWLCARRAPLTSSLCSTASRVVHSPSHPRRRTAHCASCSCRTSCRIHTP